MGVWAGSCQTWSEILKTGFLTTRPMYALIITSIRLNPEEPKRQFLYHKDSKVPDTNIFLTMLLSRQNGYTKNIFKQVQKYMNNISVLQETAPEKHTCILIVATLHFYGNTLENNTEVIV